MLSAAAALNSVEKVEELLKKPNVRVDEKDGEGCTALWIAAQNGFVGVGQALVKAGAIVDAINLQGESPLYAACRKGHIDMARLLLRNGAMIDYPARSNATPLITAALHGHVQVVMFLVDEGADLDAATQNGITAEEIAKETGHSVIHKYLKFQKECQDRKRERECQWVICSADHYNQPEPTWDIHISDEPDSNLDSTSFNANPSNLTAHLSTQRNTFVAHPPPLFPTSPGMEPTAVSPAYDDDSLLVGVLNNEGGNPFSPSTTTTSPPTQLDNLVSPAAMSSPLTATTNGVLRVPSTAATGSNASPTTGTDAALRSRNRSDLGGITYDVDPQSLFTELVRLDAGASGEVYRGVRRSDGQLFAIKKIPFSSDNDLRELQQEIHMMRRACSASQTVHTNVVRFYDAHQWEKNMWIVMEFMSGGKLTDLITSSIKLYIDEGVIAYFCLEILKGLQYLHDRCIIHRDIKSDNVLVGHDGSVKLGDFGLSAIVDKEERRTTVLGTPFWMAPEVISGDKDHPYDERADIWSLGILAVELADGQPPYINEPPVKALMRIVQQPAPRIRTESHWSEEMRDFIYGMLQKDPAKRPSAKQMREHHFLRKACGPEKIGKLVEKRRKKDVKK